MNRPILKRWSSSAGLALLATCALALGPVLAQEPGATELAVAVGAVADPLAAGQQGDSENARQGPQLQQPTSLAPDWVTDGEADCQPEPCRNPTCDARCRCRSGPGQPCAHDWSDGAWRLFDLGYWTGGECQLLQPWWLLTLFRHSATSPRDIGKGQPLVGTSWLNRPYYVGWYLGPMFGDDPIAGGMDQGNDAFGGFFLGWDCDHYWGTQLRLGWAALRLTDHETPERGHNNDIFLADLSLLYYPWGDSRWRPYALLGLGTAGFDFTDHGGNGHDTLLLALPYGIGLKYQFRRWMAVRAEVLDNVAFGSEGLSTMHNVSLTLGVEAHWGATPKSYWPWHPGRHVW